MFLQRNSSQGITTQISYHLIHDIHDIYNHHYYLVLNEVFGLMYVDVHRKLYLALYTMQLMYYTQQNNVLYT